MRWSAIASPTFVDTKPRPRRETTADPGTIPLADATDWEPDFLPGFEQRTLTLPDDEEGPVVATLIRKTPQPGDAPDTGIDLLYVHGWCDYFFQTHLAEFWSDLGVQFYALDLRKYGRSLRDWQTPGYIDTLRTYGADLEAALRAIGHGATSGRSERRLILMGHSTGGLTLPLWLDKNPGRAAALVLNSPWLEFQIGSAGRRALEAPIHAQARVAPKSHLANVDLGLYARSISNRHNGEWEIDPKMRPDDGWGFPSGWLSAIFRGQERIARGLNIHVPILALMSARSTTSVRWHPEMMSADSVLNVSTVTQRLPLLGSFVTIARFDGALHDVTLSAEPVRAQVFRQTERWFDGIVR